MFEGFWLQTIPGAGGVGVRGPPGGVAGLVPLSGSHLMYLYCDELVHTYMMKLMESTEDEQNEKSDHDGQ